MLNHCDLTKLLYSALHGSTWRLHNDEKQFDMAKQLATKILSVNGKAPNLDRSLDNFKARWISFLELPRAEGRKTRFFRVYNADSGYLLGEIKWWGTFRSYCFFPAPNCVFETTCMNDIKEYLLLLMQEWREGQKQNKEPA